MPNTETNSYTIGYALVFTAAVAIILALVATVMKPMQDVNRANAKRVAILGTVTQFDRSDPNEVQALFESSIEQMVIDARGNVVEGANAFDIDIAKEYRKDEADRNLPVYIYSDNGKKTYVVPLYGSGLWGWISAFIALDEDLSTVKAASFDHEGETPGLGAEIRDSDWFPAQFPGKKFFDEDGSFVSIDVLKGQGNQLDDYTVDGVSGGTITSRGVATMLMRMQGYEAYFNTIKS